MFLAYMTNWKHKSTRKHSNGMPTVRFSSSVGSRVFGRYTLSLCTLSPGYPTPWISYPSLDTLPPGYPTSLDTLPRISYSPGYPTRITKGPWDQRYATAWKVLGTSDQEGTWHPRYPTPTCKQTDACEISTFPQLLLRAVKIIISPWSMSKVTNKSHKMHRQTLNKDTCKRGLI